jgi:uncharacterized protein
MVSVEAMRIVVAGGSGFLGRALIERLRADGHETVILTRRPKRAGEIAWAPYEAPAGQPWAAAIAGADAVVNLAGESIAGRRWTAARKRAIHDSRVVPTRAIAAAIAAAGHPPRVLVSSSAVGIYGSRGEERLTEESRLGTGFLADVGRGWEAAAAVPPPTRPVLVRSGVVLDRHGGALPQMALPFRFFVGGRTGSGRQYMSWIHLDDWTAMVRWALVTDAVSGPLNATAPGPVTNAEFARTLGRVLRRPALVPAPAPTLRLLLGELADALLLEGQRVLPAKALASGFDFRYASLEEALRAIYQSS